MTTNHYVQDEGLASRVPATHLPITFFVEAYHRLGGDLAQLQKGFSLEPWQLHAAMAFYCANKEMFDAENERFLESQRNIRQDRLISDEIKKEWTQTRRRGLGEEATDEETDAALERMS
jgi:hypothetical protein